MAVLRNGLVIDASETAQEWSVHIALPKRLAKQRCPNLIFQVFNPDDFREEFKSVWNICAGLSPLVEPTDFHEGFVDLTGCTRRHQSPADLMNEIAWRFRFQYGLELLWGGGQDRWIAQVACGDNRFVAPDEEPAYLAACSLKKLQLPGNTLDRLWRLGIKTVGDLVNAPLPFLQTHLGLSASQLQPFLQRGDATVRALFPPPILEVSDDVEGWNEEDITRALYSIADKASAILKNSSQQCSAIGVKFHIRGGKISQELKLAKPSNSPTVICKLLIDSWKSHGAPELTHVELELRDLLPAPRPQGELWQRQLNHTQKTEQLEHITTQVEQKFGHQSLRTAEHYRQQIPPRFAQMVYARRGFHLP